MMQTHLFFCETKMGFSEYSVFWKVGSGFETLTSRMAPLNERIVQKHKASEGGTKHYRKQWCYFLKGHASLLKHRGFVGGFIQAVLSLEACAYGYFIRLLELCLSRRALVNAGILLPKSLLFCRMCIYRCLLLVSPASSERREPGRKKPAGSLSWCQLTASGRQSLVLDVGARLV